MSAARIASINFECPDPVSLARFWADLLDGEIVVETPDFCAVKIDSIYLGTTRVDDYLPPTWPSPERLQQAPSTSRSTTSAPTRRRPSG
jgi:hypothetical protein